MRHAFPIRERDFDRERDIADVNLCLNHVPFFAVTARVADRSKIDDVGRAGHDDIVTTMNRVDLEADA